jgi:transposase
MDMDHYTKAFETKMVQRMLLPGGPTPSALSKRTGVPRSTLQLWKMEAMGKESWNDRAKKRKQAQTREAPRRPEDWPAEERLRVVLAAASLDADALGELLRREGLHEATLAQWKASMLEALSPKPRDTNAKRVAELERELLRKDKALAETAALLVLQKKVQALWAVADDDTTEPTESASSRSSKKR